MEKNRKSMIASLLIMLLLPNLLFGAGVEDLITYITDFVNSIITLVPLLVKLGLMFFAILCVFVMPIASYVISFRHFKKQDERNESDTSATMTIAKASSMAILGLLGGLLLFQLVAITGMGLDSVVGGNFGDVLSAVLMLNLR